MNYRGHAEFKMPRNYVANDSYPMLETKEQYNFGKFSYVVESKEN